MLRIVIISLLLIYGFIYLILSVKTCKPFKTMFLFAFLGVVSLLIINLTAKYTGINLQVNEYTVGISGIFGLPGVIFLLIINMIFV